MVHRLPYIMRNFLLFLVTAFLAIATQAQANTLNLVQNGKTSYVIALAADAIPAEKTAATQLQKYLQQMTGAQFNIETETALNDNTPQILIGAGHRAKALLPQQNGDSLTSDGIVIKTVGSNLILAGGRPRGTLYAVYEFLETSAGCRWWTPTESTIPQKASLSVSPQDVAYVPTFQYREHFTHAVQNNPEFTVIMRQNGYFQRQPWEWGGHHSILGWSHTFGQLLPAKQYFKDHPHWFSDPNNGNKPGTANSKIPASTQLCLSNPEVVEAVAEKALAWIAKNPNAGYISISQDDNNNFCQDPADVALAEREGSYAGPLLNFVNQVAARIQEKHPGFLVETLAYGKTAKPPKTIRPAANVLIRLAPIEADFGHPMNSDWNAAIRDNLLEWAKIAPRLFVWNYVTNFKSTVFPHPNWAGLGPDLRFFAANNVKGVFEQGDNYTHGIGDFVQLRTWLLAKLLWNPNLDQEKLTDEFLQGYYGPAAPHLKAYINLLQDAFLARDIKLSTYNTNFSFLTLDVVNQAHRLFQQAAEAVKHDKTLSGRVRRERLSLDIATLYRHKILTQEAQLTGKPFLGAQEPTEAMTQFITAAKAFGLRKWSESANFADQIPFLEDMFKPAAPLPDFAQGFPAMDVIDIQERTFTLYSQGSESAFVDDPTASNGKAASIIGDTNKWAIQAPLGNYLDNSTDQWQVYVMARLDAKADAPQNGGGFSCGIYDVTNSKFVKDTTVTVAKIAGTQYHAVDLGVNQLSDGMYIWAAPTRNTAVEKVYVDRIILIRKK